MTVANATPLAKHVSTEDAREELSRFFVIADMAEQTPGMFSAFIDAEWHRLAETSDYSDFCKSAVGHGVEHAPINGDGVVEWLDLYHERFGALPPAWFADIHGVVDQSGYDRYLNTRTVTACWNCTPTTGDPDFTKPGMTSPDPIRPPVPDHGTDEIER